jgi:hypothetical protein
MEFWCDCAAYQQASVPHWMGTVLKQLQARSMTAAFEPPLPQLPYDEGVENGDLMDPSALLNLVRCYCRYW